MQRVAFPVVVSLVAPVLTDYVRLIPGNAHRDVIRPSVTVACSIYHHRMWNQESSIVSNCQHIGTPEGRLVGEICEKSALVYRLQPLSYAAQGQSASHIQLQHRPTSGSTLRSFRKQSITLCCPLKKHETLSHCLIISTTAFAARAFRFGASAGSPGRHSSTLNFSASS